MRKTETKIALSFLSVILAGAFLLYLPWSTHSGYIPMEDALFTSTSAVTVTGLSTVDTEYTFTVFGKIIIMLLIQVGGLGFMTFSTFTIIFMGRSFSLKDKSIIEDGFTAGSYKNVKDLLRRIILLTFTIEGVGAVSLYFCFSELSGFHRVFAAVFHAVSAFCNAGFSLFSTGFEKYLTHVGLNLTVCLLIITGGIGFVVMNEALSYTQFKKRKPKRLSLHSRMVLIVTGALISAGFLLILIQELLNEGNSLPLGAKIMSAFFHSVSARTAGFNTVKMGQFSMGTLFILIVLMYIGASPGSTGGGIKTTSFGVALAYVRSRFRGREKIDLFYRTIPAKTFEKAFMVIVTSATVIVCAVVLVFMFQPTFQLVDVLFETVSAFGTVGLSTGLTGSFNLFAKLIIIITMFIGRVGPLTVLVALGQKETKAVFNYPQEDIMIG